MKSAKKATASSWRMRLRAGSVGSNGRFQMLKIFAYVKKWNRGLTSPCGGMKKTKKSVDYGKGMQSAHCGICVHFRSPNACELVIGPIGPRGWCKLFSKKPEKAKD